jgi:hypothetical protein
LPQATALKHSSTDTTEIIIMKSICAISGAALMSLATSAASAAPPASLGGTAWNVQANRDAVQLVITNQGGPGAPGGATCPLIIGTIGIAPMRGWYCPATGRIHFLHNNLSTGATVRVFSGSVSDEVPGQSLYMGGTMAVFNAAFGYFGEYNFSATQ